MLVLIDNYDSFTYNLYQAIAAIGVEVRVVRNDQASVDEIAGWQPDRLMISPGPGMPSGAGISVSAVQRFAGHMPVLGVCLGHQSLAAAFGGRVVRADRLMHGKTSPIHHDGRTVFSGLANPFEATRYHSLVVDRDGLPDDFEVSAWTEEQEIMGLRHRPTGAEGVQFHPESILSPAGQHLLENFVKC